MLEETEAVSCYIESMTYSLTLSKEGLKVINLIKKTTKNVQIKECLSDCSKSAEFLNLIVYFRDFVRKFSFPRGKKKKGSKDKDLDIVICGHGAIKIEKKHCASFLMPLPAIKDVILYSPWNCAIDASVANGIATGLISLNDWDFFPSKNRPSSLLQRWNSMREAGDQLIPEIVLYPVWHGERVWKALTAYRGPTDENRILVPYLIPLEKESEYFPEAPFYVVLLALSVILTFTVCSKAKVHFAGCLSRDEDSCLTEDD